MSKKKGLSFWAITHTVRANLQFLWCLADRTRRQSVAGNFPHKTSTPLHLGRVRKWRLIIFPKDKTRSTDAGNWTLDPLIQSLTLYRLCQRAPHVPKKVPNNVCHFAPSYSFICTYMCLWRSLFLGKIVLVNAIRQSEKVSFRYCWSDDNLLLFCKSWGNNLFKKVSTAHINNKDR